MSQTQQGQETSQSSKDVAEDTASSKDKENNDPATSNNRNADDENVEAMDFEEISDGELEEDIKTSGKGLGDALGVDWESLVKESQPRRTTHSNHESAQSRWQCKAIFRRIGISAKNAGDELYREITQKYKSEDSDELLLDKVALMHSALFRKRMTREPAISTVIDLSCRKREDDDLGGISETRVNFYEDAKLLLRQTA